MYKDLTKIKTKEEYESTKTELQSYVDEYSWLVSTPNPKKEIAEEMKGLVESLEGENTREEQLDILSRIHRLQVKYTSISTGEYESDLKRNITATLVVIEQYEAMQEERKFGDICLGVIKGDADTKNYLQRRFMVSSANKNGAAPNAINLGLEKADNILDYIAKNYQLVNIKIDKGENALVPTEEISNRVQERVQQMSDKFIDEQLEAKGIKKEQKVSEQKNPEQEVTTNVNEKSQELSEMEKEKIAIKKGKKKDIDHNVNGGREI